MAAVKSAGSRGAAREALRLARRSIASDTGRPASGRIGMRLLALPEYRRARVTMFYVGDGEEVATEGLIREALSEGKRVAVPWCDRGRGSLVAAEIRDFDADLEEGCYGIPAPPGDRLSIIPVSRIDLFVVPGLGFDPRGGRLGRGKGYYDRFLRGKADDAVTIGLAFEVQLSRLIETRPHDVRMDMVLTEERKIDCAKIRSRLGIRC